MRVLVLEWCPSSHLVLVLVVCGVSVWVSQSRRLASVCAGRSQRLASVCVSVQVEVQVE